MPWPSARKLTATRPNATAIPQTVKTVEKLFSSGAYDAARIAAAGSLLAFRKNGTAGLDA